MQKLIHTRIYKFIELHKTNTLISNLTTENILCRVLIKLVRKLLTLSLPFKPTGKTLRKPLSDLEDAKWIKGGND